jgi:hypothetical protein
MPPADRQNFTRVSIHDRTVETRYASTIRSRMQPGVGQPSVHVVAKRARTARLLGDIDLPQQAGDTEPKKHSRDDETQRFERQPPRRPGTQNHYGYVDQHDSQY